MDEHTHFHQTVETPRRMTALADWLKKFRGKQTRAEKITEQLPDNTVVSGNVVYRLKDCDCVPKVKHGPHWKADWALTQQYIG